LNFFHPFGDIDKVFLFLSSPSSPGCFILSDGAILLPNSFIIRECTGRNWEKLSSLFICDHVRDNLSDYVFILLLGILLIQDTEFLILDADASETIFAGIDMLTVITFATSIFSGQDKG